MCLFPPLISLRDPEMPGEQKLSHRSLLFYMESANSRAGKTTSFRKQEPCKLLQAAWVPQPTRKAQQWLHCLLVPLQASPHQWEHRCPGKIGALGRGSRSSLPSPLGFLRNCWPLAAGRLGRASTHSPGEPQSCSLQEDTRLQPWDTGNVLTTTQHSCR